MIIYVTSGRPIEIELTDPSVFTAFKVSVAAGVDPEMAREALGQLAEWVDPDHVAIVPDRVRELAGDAASDPEWERGFGGMVDYAKSKGWTDGLAIRAHVEWAE